MLCLITAKYIICPCLNQSIYNKIFFRDDLYKHAINNRKHIIQSSHYMWLFAEITYNYTINTKHYNDIQQRSRIVKIYRQKYVQWNSFTIVVTKQSNIILKTFIFQINHAFYINSNWH